MQITNRVTQDSSVEFNISIFKEDYQGNLTKELNNYKKSARMNGFRDGKVPMELIKKKYEKTVLFEQIEKIIQKALEEHIKSEKIEIFGTPIPLKDHKVDWEGENFEFKLQAGLIPEFSLNLKEVEEKKYDIVPNEADVENKITELRNQFGKFEKRDQCDSLENWVFGKLQEISDSEKENLWNSAIRFQLKELKKKTQDKFLGKKLGDSIEFDTSELFSKKEKWEDLVGDKKKHFEASFAIKEIFEITPAELDEGFFNKVYPKEALKRSEEFVDKTKLELLESYKQESDYFFYKKVIDNMIENINFTLPKSFIFEWMASQNPTLKEEEFQKQYPTIEKELKIQFLENKLTKDFSIEVSQKELEDEIRKSISLEYEKLNYSAVSEAQIEAILAEILKNKTQTEQVSRNIIKKKILSSLKENVSIESKKISWKEFVAEVRSQL